MHFLFLRLGLLKVDFFLKFCAEVTKTLYHLETQYQMKMLCHLIFSLSKLNITQKEVEIDSQHYNNNKWHKKEGRSKFWKTIFFHVNVTD